MQVNISARHMDLTGPIEAYIHKKVERITRHFDRVQQLSVVIEKQPRHGFHVELITDIEGHADFVANSTHEDLYAAVDLVVDRGVRQLTDHKEKVRNHHHPHQ
ncbi:MAG: ribosome-associated translation inhibitor RaiA [Phycisphaeraceae bacterium]|nr:ribosome-associated translation inhibitor RaiA [Phycisphaeraceae bacterium]